MIRGVRRLLGATTCSSLGVHDDRVAWLAGELFDPDGYAVDDRACGQVAVDTVGVGAGLPQVAQPGMHRAQMRLHLAGAGRGVARLRPSAR
jgi:hypothetical protein